MNLSTLTVAHVLWRTLKLFPSAVIVERTAHGGKRVTTYREVAERALRLANALRQLGVKPGDRVATLMWNTVAHLELYLAVPVVGAICHTLNLRLSPDDLAYIANHGEDRFLVVDQSLVPVYEAFRDRVDFRRVVVVGDGGQLEGADSYQQLLQAEPLDWGELPQLDAETPAFLLHTSGTTGRPKGILYTHGQLALAALAITSTVTFAVSGQDCVLMTVPMFHVAGWALPYAALIAGAKVVFPGPRPRPEDLLQLLSEEQATFAAGVPTVWHDVANLLDQEPGRWPLSPRLRIIMGGSAPPEGLLRRLEAHGVKTVHGWGMSEVLLGLQAHVKLDRLPAEERYHWLGKQGMPAPFVEARIVDAEGRDLPWDGRTSGELLVRGAWIADSYYRGESPDSFVDGWLRTGDVAVMDQEGYVKIVDRVKDLIKSGGEWIGSIELENLLMNHPAVQEAAVIGVPHKRWQERPLALVVVRPGHTVTAEELRSFLAQHVVRWWIPDDFVFVDELPKTSTGKVAKAKLREQYANWEWRNRV